MKICIDPGHNASGGDTGASGIGGIKEQDITFDIAKRLKDLLIPMGHQVIMTRSSLTQNLGTNVLESLQKRVKISNDNKCDFFISLHCNSGTSTAMGTETLIAGKGGLAEVYAKKVQSEICTSLGTLNRGVRVDTEYLKSKLYVLHNTLCPAILIETGFITNQSDAKKLTDEPQKFARSIAKAFSDNSYSPVFSDIGTHWAKEYIEKLHTMGLVNGFGDGTFRPDQPMTRGEVCALISNAMSIK